MIVRTRAQEFHYPKGEDNVYIHLRRAPAASPLDSFWKKLLFAARFRNYQILLSDDITTESRLMFDRQIRRRVAKIAPFLTFDEDPYPVVQRRAHLLDLRTPIRSPIAIRTPRRRRPA